MTNALHTASLSCAAVACTAILFLLLAAPAQGDPSSSSSPSSSSGHAKWPAPDELPSIPDLPDPFLKPDGTRVKSREEWKAQRAWLRDMILHYEYGNVPPAPPAGNVQAEEDPAYQAPKESGSNAKIPPPTEPVTRPQGMTEKTYRLSFGPDHKASTHLILSMPAGKGPHPVIIKGDLCWGRVKPEMVADAVKRGYAVAEFDRTEFAHDDKEFHSSGVFPLYPDYEWRDISAWAWGFARVVDYLVTRDDIDRSKIVVTGHSRGGKGALLAGALDERVALTVPNGSGAGGAGCYRYQAPKSEDIQAITGHFPFWFSPIFPQFIGKMDRIPFDQHTVKALVAPRALLTTDGLGDLWANPEGTQVTYTAAKEVYQFLGARDKIGIHFREGHHEQNRQDWTALLDFADLLFAGKSPAEQFSKLAFPDAPKMFHWSAPKAGE